MITILKASKKGQKFTRCTGRNGNILHATETFKRKSGCLRNIVGAMTQYLDVYEGRKPVILENGNAPVRLYFDKKAKTWTEK